MLCDLRDLERAYAFEDLFLQGSLQRASEYFFSWQTSRELFFWLKKLGKIARQEEKLSLSKERFLIFAKKKNPDLAIKSLQLADRKKLAMIERGVSAEEIYRLLGILLEGARDREWEAKSRLQKTNYFLQEEVVSEMEEEFAYRRSLPYIRYYKLYCQKDMHYFYSLGLSIAHLFSPSLQLSISDSARQQLKLFQELLLAEKAALSSLQKTAVYKNYDYFLSLRKALENELKAIT